MRKSHVDSASAYGTPTKQTYSLPDILGEILTKEEAIEMLRKDPELYHSYQNLPLNMKSEFLDIIMGHSGLRITYDSVFKEIMNPRTHPERLESLLSALMGEPVTILEVLEHEGIRLVEEGSFVIMDTVVELSDGAISNVEIQKVGYEFPGERASCYLSDLIMRQYNRRKAEYKNSFSFSQMKPVNLIVLMEKSPTLFSSKTPQFLHRGEIRFDTGIPLPCLPRVAYIALDTFHATVQNVSNNLEAWLTFLTLSDADRIVDLVNYDPRFLQCYKDLSHFRQNPMEVMKMFSEELRIMDRNLGLYMIKQRDEKISELDKVIAEKRSVIAEMDSAIAEKDSAIAEKDSTIAALQAELSRIKNQS